jgi:DNA-binding NarL/FixJ family response regulator
LEGTVVRPRRQRRPRQPATVDQQAAPLARRQRQVAALIAQGLTNREIGAELVIAESTVETYVKGILRKLRFRSRAQIAAWAVQQGLLATPPERKPAPPAR